MLKPDAGPTLWFCFHVHHPDSDLGRFGSRWTSDSGIHLGPGTRCWLPSARHNPAAQELYTQPQLDVHVNAEAKSLQRDACILNNEVQPASSVIAAGRSCNLTAFHAYASWQGNLGCSD